MDCGLVASRFGRYFDVQPLPLQSALLRLALTTCRSDLRE